jgi:Protein of unknown function (DUF3089)
VAAVAALALLTAACSSGPAVPATTSHASGTVWLCRPGLASDPCAFTSQATSVQSGGAQRAASLAALAPHATPGAFSCFYVYPTVSLQQEANTDLTVKKVEVDAAMAQAAPFSGVCSVWAPMYRSQTWQSVSQGLSGDASVLHSTFAVAYGSLLSAWQDFLANDDHGRPVILIGDSQGAAILIHLIATQLEDDPALLRRLLVAIIVGGNLQVAAGKAGGTFEHVPLCTSRSQTGCVIAFSSYPAEPPPDSLFGRPGQGVSLQSGQPTRPGEQVACVNPAALGGGTAGLSPYFPTVTQTSLNPAPATPWVTYPGLYSAACESRGGATWLQVSDVAGPGDKRPIVSQQLGPTWGYHADDVGLTLGNLIQDIAGEEAAWVAAHG